MIIVVKKKKGVGWAEAGIQGATTMSNHHLFVFYVKVTLLSTAFLNQKHTAHTYKTFVPLFKKIDRKPQNQNLTVVQIQVIIT